MVSKILDQALKRKKLLLNENSQYQTAETLLHRRNTGKYLGDAVYGANDGVITTFAIIAGAAGANLAPLFIVILGLSNIVADGISMGASNYLGSKSELDFAKKEREKEAWEIENLRELEIAEVEEIFAKKGFKGKDLKRAVEIITSNKEVWLDTMMVDELGILVDENEDPKKHGLVTFVAFVLTGFIPLLPFLIPGIPNPFAVSIVVAGLTLFLVGALRSFITVVSFIVGGLEMFLIGASAAGVAYFISYIIEKAVR